MRVKYDRGVCCTTVAAITIIIVMMMMRDKSQCQHWTDQ